MPTGLPLGSLANPSVKNYTSPGIRAFPTNHPYVQNKDGSRSNVLIFGYQPEKQGPIYAIPSMVNGVKLNESEAIKIAQKQGLDKYPRHNTSAEHNQWAKTFHDKINESGVIMNKPISSKISDLLNFKR